jgi:hypothetical protein
LRWGLDNFLSRWPPTTILLISSFQVVGVSYCIWILIPQLEKKKKKPQGLALARQVV